MYSEKDLAFALGYYHGRAEGYEHQEEGHNDNEILRHWYRMGYDRGVADYCELDVEQEDE